MMAPDANPSTMQRFIETTSLAAFAALLFLWSVPDVIAARNALLALLLVLALLLKPDFSQLTACLRQRSVAIPLLALTAWIALHCAVLAWNPGRAWHEAAQWFKAVPIFALGVALGQGPGWRTQPNRVSAWGGATVVAYLIYLIFQVIYKPWDLPAPAGQILLQTTRIGSRDLASYLGTALVALQLADLVAYSARGRGLVNGPVWLRALALIAATALTVATMTRNALPILLLLGAIAASAFIATRPRQTRLRAIALVAVAAVLLASGIAINVKHDARWARFASSVAIGLDIEHQKAWLAQEQTPLPLNAQGLPVDDSAYMRTAWMKGLLTEIARHPLGVGYDRNAFGNALRADYGKWVTTGHGHAGVFDFTVGVGIPGGLLLLAFFVALAAAGLRRWRDDRDAAGLALLLFVVSYASRAFIDGIVRDHMLEQFMLIAGLLLALAHTNKAQQA